MAPLQHGAIQLSRSGLDVTFAARFHLLAAMNHCPCGSSDRCRCTAQAIRGYHHGVPSFLAERFGITLDVPPRPRREDCPPPSPTSVYRAQVEAARERQAHRYAAMPGLPLNAQLSASLVAKFCALTRPATLLLEEALTHEALSPSVQLQLLAVARSCADLNGHEHIHDEDLIVALSMPPFPLATGRLPRHHA